MSSSPHITRLTLASFVVVACFAATLMVGCDRKADDSSRSDAATPNKAKPLVCTTFYPTTYFAQRIGGDWIEVSCPCPSDADPIFWLPDAKALETYQKADLIIVNGASFEKWLTKVSLPQSRVVDTAKPFEESFIVIESSVTHSHGPEGKHTHEGIDGHTWLDPINAKTQASQIENALIKHFPTHKDAFKAGHLSLVKDLDALDAKLKSVSTKLSDQTLLCSHPAYNYLARRYGWKIKNFHLDPETMPDDQTITKIKLFLGEQPASLMLWEAEPAKEIATWFETQLDIKSIVFSPCEGLDPADITKGTTYFSVMNANIDTLGKVLSEMSSKAVAPPPEQAAQE
ncbi:MAG: zinc ABC transporter substrate-binding protein [Actinomycetia bacterium]|nr:zinc ABC transporter substrate-binding protein [Actinomycetes bacterium]